MTAQIRATVVWCGAGQVPIEIAVDLAPGATVRDVIVQSGVLTKNGATVVDALDVGIFNRPCGLDAPVRHNDRVELYRPLAIDPKEARRIRAEVRRKKKAAQARP
jgi:putative ubiquitin-RnfH superfamily antitoxin RatB of RatAB toxin-antitoxin module